MVLTKKHKEWWATFTPRSLNGLTLWLDDPNIPSNIIEDGSNRVSQWNDISGKENNFIQNTGLDQPLRSGSEITFDGSSEFLDGSANIANFQDDAAGELIIVWESLELTTAFARPFTMSDESTDNDRILFGKNNGNNNNIFFDPGVSNNVIFGTHGGGRVISDWSSSGTAYRFFENTAEQARTSGTDNGNWFGDLGANKDKLSLGATIETTPFFDNVRMSSVIYYNRQLTVQERTNVNTFLNDRFSLGL